MLFEHYQAFVPKALKLLNKGRSSDSLAFEAFPSVSWRSVTGVSKAQFELTAAGTAQDLHLFPY